MYLTIFKSYYTIVYGALQPLDKCAVAAYNV